MKGTLFRLIPPLLGTLCIAAIIHISSIMLMPYVSARNPAQIIGKTFPVNQMEQVDSGNISTFMLPFTDPAMRMAVCSYDISEKPIRIIIETGGTFLSVILMRPDGKIFYSMTDKSAIQRKLDLVVATPAQVAALESQDSDDEAVQEWRLNVPETKGIVMIRAFVPRLRESADIQALLGRAECYQE